MTETDCSIPTENLKKLFRCLVCFKVLLCHNNKGDYSSQILTGFLFFLFLKVRTALKESFKNKKKKKRPLKSAVHVICRIHNKHSLHLGNSSSSPQKHIYYEHAKSPLVWNCRVLAEHVDLQVTSGPTALFLYISKAVTRHVGMLENTMSALKWQTEKGRSAACCYQLEGPVGATCYKHMRN